MMITDRVCSTTQNENKNHMISVVHNTRNQRHSLFSKFIRFNFGEFLFENHFSGKIEKLHCNGETAAHNFAKDKTNVQEKETIDDRGQTTVHDIRRIRQEQRDGKVDVRGCVCVCVLC